MRPDVDSEAADDLADALARTGRADREALREVYALSCATLFGICVDVCGDRRQAERLLQDVYLTVWRRASAWDPTRSEALPWLASVARDHAITWRRANDVPLAIQIYDAAPRADPPSLASLDARQRGAIQAAFVHGATYAELADHFGVPLGAMKWRVRRGLARMADARAEGIGDSARRVDQETAAGARAGSPTIPGRTRPGAA